MISSQELYTAPTLHPLTTRPVSAQAACKEASRASNRQAEHILSDWSHALQRVVAVLSLRLGGIQLCGRFLWKEKEETSTSAILWCQQASVSAC